MWLDDIILVTKGHKDEHWENLFKKLKQLQEAEYRANEKKSEFLLKKIICMEDEITDYGIKPNKEKIKKTVLQLNPPISYKELKSFLGA